MIYIYCRRPSDSAKELVKELDATRIRRFDGEHFWRKGKRVTIKEGDFIVCWGDELPLQLDGVHILNGATVGNKYQAYKAFVNAGITVPEHQLSNTPSWRSLSKPSIENGWLPRTNYHTGGNDLLRPPVVPDFWVQKLKLDQEFRIHTFAGKSIRAGIKVLRDGFTLGTPNEGETKASDWIRSYDAGWRIRYDSFQSKKEMRTLAHKAVAALGLTFGAVDIGFMKESNKYVVLEVNRAPGLEGGTITAYTNAIKRWLDDPAGVQRENQEGEQTAQQPAPEEPAGAINSLLQTEIFGRVEQNMPNFAYSFVREVAVARTRVPIESWTTIPRSQRAAYRRAGYFPDTEQRMLGESYYYFRPRETNANQVNLGE